MRGSSSVTTEQPTHDRGMSIAIGRYGALARELWSQQDIAGPLPNYRNKDFAEWAGRAADMHDEIVRLTKRVEELKDGDHKCRRVSSIAGTNRTTC